MSFRVPISANVLPQSQRLCLSSMLSSLVVIVLDDPGDLELLTLSPWVVARPPHQAQHTIYLIRE